MFDNNNDITAPNSFIWASWGPFFHRRRCHRGNSRYHCDNCRH